MWYFELQLDSVESKYLYTPELPRFLSCFHLILKQQCILVCCVNSCGVQIKGHINIEFCLQIDTRCNYLYLSETNLNYTSILRKPSWAKNTECPSYVNPHSVCNFSVRLLCCHLVFICWYKGFCQRTKIFSSFFI